MPPTTGHYVLHLSVDDGVRLWLNGQELLNEWRGQSLSYYQLAVDLTAGEPYALRLEYCQYSASTRARLAWASPPTPARRQLAQPVGQTTGRIGARRHPYALPV
ncbi:MAG: PA14 domain-containing protein [Hymenobacter sp.]